MKINEEEYEHNHKFKVKKVKYKSDGTDDKVLEPLENGASFVLFNGKPKSGKTTVMLSWLTKRAFYLKRFHTVFVYSPSLLSGSLEDDHPLLELPEEQLRTELTLEELQKDISKIYGKKKRVLFIFDDVQQSLKGAVQNEVAKLCFNRRHLTKKGISVWISSQVYNQIPLKIRKNLSSMLLFPTRQAKERETIREEVADFLDKDEWSELLKYCFDEPHNFLYIKCNLEPRFMFFKNYCPLNLELEDD
jgi:hypothetical protein